MDSIRAKRNRDPDPGTRTTEAERLGASLSEARLAIGWTRSASTVPPWRDHPHRAATARNFGLKPIELARIESGTDLPDPDFISRYVPRLGMNAARALRNLDRAVQERRYHEEVEIPRLRRRLVALLKNYLEERRAEERKLFQRHTLQYLLNIASPRQP